MSVRGAAALVAGLAGPASALDGHPLGGTWVGRWSNGAHQEVRIDGRGDDGRVEGTFCGVRAGDGSAFWFDLDDVETNESDGTIEVRRGQDTLRFTRQSDETARYEIERLGKTHRLTLTPPSAQLRARCLERVLRAHEARERSAAAGPGLDGAWSYTGKGAHHIALEVRAVRQGHYAGTVCWQRKDRSKVFYDFAPGPRSRPERQRAGSSSNAHRSRPPSGSAPSATPKERCGGASRSRDGPGRAGSH